MALAAGTTLGVYRITAPIGAGGMGEVYRARDTRHERDVALKVLPDWLGDGDRTARFAREIGILSSLAHPHIVPLFDSGQSDGRFYFAMPFVEGESLRGHLDRRGPLGMAETARLVGEIAGALDYAHQHGVVHRDLKPENVLVHEGHAVVADFGIARALALVGDDALTRSGIVIGTPAYMSPEQAGGGQAGPRSDIYALGCVAFEMLSGVPPYTGPSRESIARQHITAPVPDLGTVRAGTSRATADAIRTAMAKSPADRFPTARAFAAKLESEAQGDRTEETTAPMPRFRGRRSRGVVVAAVSALAIAAALWIPRVLTHRAGATPSRAPDWLMVSQFDGPAAEPELATTVRELAVSGLDQSRAVITVPEDRVRQGLVAAGKPESTRVTPALARELAARYTIGAVLEGRVARIGRAVHVALRVSEAKSDSTLGTFDAQASRDEDLVATMDRLVRKLRAFFGENRMAIRSAPTLEEILTPSYEAYRLLDRASTYFNETNDGSGTLRIDREVLTLDPDCAYAYWGMSYCYRAMGLPDSAAWACDQALARARRLTSTQRLLVEAARDMHRADLVPALDLVDRALRLYPKEAVADGAIDQRDACLTWMARGTESHSSTFYGVPDPETVFGVDPTSLWNRFFGSTLRGRFARAESLLSRLPESQQLVARLCLSAYESHWSVAESLATLLIAREGPRGPDALMGYVVLREAHASIGEVEAADSSAAAWIAVAPNRTPHEPVRARLLMSEILGTPPPRPPDAILSDTSTASLVTRAWYAARTGDARQVRRLEGELRRHSPDDLRRAGAVFEFLDASIAAHEGRWRDVVSAMAPVARSGSEVGSPEWKRIGPQPGQWLVAEAFMALGQPDSAVTYFQLVTHPIGGLRWAGQSFAAATFAHQRLALAYAQLGRRADAEREWATFRASFTHPDPAMRRWIEEGEAALRRLSALPEVPKRGKARCIGLEAGPRA